MEVLEHHKVEKNTHLLSLLFVRERQLGFKCHTENLVFN
jgi:hypothetical protein